MLLPPAKTPQKAPLLARAVGPDASCRQAFFRDYEAPYATLRFDRLASVQMCKTYH
jgi:hypothetical protein